MATASLYWEVLSWILILWAIVINLNLSSSDNNSMVFLASSVASPVVFSCWCRTFRAFINAADVSVGLNSVLFSACSFEWQRPKANAETEEARKIPITVKVRRNSLGSQFSSSRLLGQSELGVFDILTLFENIDIDSNIL